MKLSSLFLAVPAALFVLGSGAASAGEAISDAGAFACVADKWAETEPEKAHKWVDYVGRCVGIPDASAAPKYTEDCVGKVRVHARWELEGQRHLHIQLSGWGQDVWQL